MRRLIKVIAWLLLTAAVGMAAAAASVYFYLVPRLPSIESLTDVRLQVPLRVYSREGALIAQFGEKRRVPVTIDEVPPRLIDAFLAAEDDRFYRHPGVDYHGLIRAAIQLALTGEKRQGGSTITMQVARNFFLTSEKTYLRKLNEILLALKIEGLLSKDEILELYLNKIYLGQRAYGVGAAAQVYYGKPIGALTLAEIATIAGLPKAPSRDNPISNPQRARERRSYVLGRMRRLGMIDDAEYAAALEAAQTASVHEPPIEVDAAYVAEMVRREMIDRYGDRAYTEGLSVITTIDVRHQSLATRALRQALVAYDRRHGYRGPERRAEEEDPVVDLADIAPLGGLLPARVERLDEETIHARLKDGTNVAIAPDGWSWARPYRSENRRGPAPGAPQDLVAVGDVIRVARGEEDAWELAQVPAIEGAFVSLLPGDGAITALVGGFDFRRSKFNRAVQAERQPGSGFKPIIYSAALEKGFTPASLINDAPVVFNDPSLEAVWRPENYSGKFFGPTRLRTALTKSRNIVSIRLLNAIGVDYAIDYAARFGLDTGKLPRNLSLALGSGALSPLEMARIYAVFANGGFRVEPYLIDRVEIGSGHVITRNNPPTVCDDCPPEPVKPLAEKSGEESGERGGEESAPDDAPGETALPDLAALLDPPPPPDLRNSGPDADAAPRHAPRILEPRNAYLMYTLLRDVVRHGTARRAQQLGRNDIAGKTGTTNDQRDAWFNGFNQTLVGISWVGFDDFSPLGNRETGGRAALPMWLDFMEDALAGVPEVQPEEPPGLARVRIDPDTGQLAAAGQPDAIFELFRVENRPAVVSEYERRWPDPARQPAGALPPSPPAEGTGGERIVAPEKLF